MIYYYTYPQKPADFKAQDKNVSCCDYKTLQYIQNIYAEQLQLL